LLPSGLFSLEEDPNCLPGEDTGEKYRMEREPDEQLSDENTEMEALPEEDAETNRTADPRAAMEREQSDEGFYEKVYDLLLESGKTINRMISLTILLSFLLIIISTGDVTIDEISFVGIKLKITAALILLGGAWIIGALYIYVIGLTKYNLALQEKINVRYEKFLEKNNKFIGYVFILSPNIVFTIIATLTQPGTSSLPKLYTGAFNLFVFVIIGAALLLFPLVAQLFAYLKVINLFHGTFWIWITFILLFVITLGDLISFLLAWFLPAEKKDR
jgi:hypothetical protein